MDRVPKGKPNATVPLKEHGGLMTPKDTGYTHISVAQPSLETLPPAENGNKCNHPQLDNVQGVRELGILGPKCDSAANFLSLWSGNPVEE